MSLLLFIAMFLGGLVAILKGADFLTDGAAAIARSMGIPTIVVGLTIVAMGSSLPEFVVSVFSAFKGNTDMAVGNIVGSNIFNILGIMGLTAAVAPISVNWTNIRNDVPFALLSSIVVLLVAWDGVMARTEGLLLLCMFAIFLSYTFSYAKADKTTSQDTGNTATTEPAHEQIMSPIKSAVMCIGGLALLLAGGNLLVDGGAGAARLLGMPESLVALTFISIGTSAPELAASLMAARKGDHGMALGNVVGSVVFNVFFVLGTAATVHPLTISGLGLVDFGTLIVASALLWIFCRYGKAHFTLTRTEGIILTLIAVAYYAWLIQTA